MRDFARESGLKLLPVCMKADKLSRGAGIQAAAKIARLLEVTPKDICIVSGTEKTGIEQVWNQIEAIAAE